MSTTSNRAREPTNGHSHVETVEGYRRPRCIIDRCLGAQSFTKHVHSVRQMSMREDDILLCSYAKSGSNVVWQILNILQNGFSKTTEQQTKQSQMIDTRASETLDAVRSPRVLNTHFPPHLLPVKIPDMRTRVVLAYRNPKDVCAASIEHYERLLGNKTLSASTLIACRMDFLSEDHATPYSYFKYMCEFHDYFLHNPDIPTLLVSYEDLLSNPLKQIRRMSEFVGRPCSNQLLEDIVTSCGFHQSNNCTIGHEEDSDEVEANGQKRTLFPGKVGMWKNDFTVAESEMFDSVTDHELAHTGITFRYH